MNESINFILLLSVFAAGAGTVLYMIEIAMYRVHRFTRWSELSRVQWFSVLLMLGGAATFLGTLIIGALLK